MASGHDSDGLRSEDEASARVETHGRCGSGDLWFIYIYIYIYRYIYIYIVAICIPFADLVHSFTLFYLAFAYVVLSC